MLALSLGIATTTACALTPTSEDRRSGSSLEEGEMGEAPEGAEGTEGEAGDEAPLEETPDDYVAAPDDGGPLAEASEESGRAAAAPFALKADVYVSIGNGQTKQMNKTLMPRTIGFGAAVLFPQAFVIKQSGASCFVQQETRVNPLGAQSETLFVVNIVTHKPAGGCIITYRGQVPGAVDLVPWSAQLNLNIK